MITFTNLDPQGDEDTRSTGGPMRHLNSLVKFTRLPPLFLLLVILPTAAVAFYYLFLAAPMYISEARFVVRSPSMQAPSTLDSVLVGVGLGSAGSSMTDAFAVHEYITSRDAVADLDKDYDLRRRLARPITDFIARFPRPLEGGSFEDLYSAYSRFVTVSYNSQTGISTLQVKAFTPRDASELATALLNGGEVVINRLNQRAAEDAVGDAERHMTEAESHVTASEAQLTDFRNKERLIDPTRSSLADLELVAKIEGQLASLRAERAALAASAPQSPQLPLMDQQIVAFQAQADDQKSKIAGQDTSLAPLIGEYERLMIERDFAAKELVAASSAAETARMDLHRKHLYLERIVAPNTPDAPRAPRRLHNIIVALLTFLLVYGSVVLVRAGFREHGQTT